MSIIAQVLEFSEKLPSFVRGRMPSTYFRDSLCVKFPKQFNSRAAVSEVFKEATETERHLVAFHYIFLEQTYTDVVTAFSSEEQLSILRLRGKASEIISKYRKEFK